MNPDSNAVASEAKHADGMELLQARGVLYTLVAAAFTEPQSERFQLLRETRFQTLCRAAARIGRERAQTRRWTRFGPAEAAPTTLPAELVLDRLPSTTDLAREHFSRVFGFTMAKDCPPHAVEFCANDNMFYRSQRLADIAGFFQAFGLTRTRNNRDREDHIVYLAEFMAFLLAKQQSAVAEGHSAEQQAMIERAARAFFAEHCGWWWPAFARCLQTKAGADSFYGVLGQFLRHFTAWERHLFELPEYQECPEPTVPRFVPEGACFACAAHKP